MEASEDELLEVAGCERDEFFAQLRKVRAKIAGEMSRTGFIFSFFHNRFEILDQQCQFQGNFRINCFAICSRRS